MAAIMAGTLLPLGLDLAQTCGGVYGGVGNPADPDQ
jgi:hypothetical protein